MRSKRKIQIVAAVAATVAILGTGLETGAGSPASAGTVGSGFTVDSGDLMFILKQIKIAERHVLSIAGHQDIDLDTVADAGFDGSPPTRTRTRAIRCTTRSTARRWSDPTPTRFPTR